MSRIMFIKSLFKKNAQLIVNYPILPLLVNVCSSQERELGPKLRHNTEEKLYYGYWGLLIRNCHKSNGIKQGFLYF